VIVVRVVTFVVSAVLSLAVTGPMNLIGPLAQPGWSSALLVVGAAFGAAGQLVYAITNVSLRQRLCPDHLLSRVSATMRFLILGTFPAGALIGGTLGEVLGLRGTLWVSGALLTVAALPVHLALRHTRDTVDLARAVLTGFWGRTTGRCRPSRSPRRRPRSNGLAPTPRFVGIVTAACLVEN
jgi:MFS family permease